MSENSPIKDALYTEIDDLGQERIHDLLLEGKFSELFEKIYQPSINKIKENIDEYEKHGMLAESLTHYLFTEMLIPSQRKIIFEDIELDMIIPNTAELKKNINDVVLIHFVKTSKKIGYKVPINTTDKKYIINQLFIKIDVSLLKKLIFTVSWFPFL